MKGTEISATIVMVLAIAIFLGKLYTGEMDLGWLNTALWSFMFAIKR